MDFKKYFNPEKPDELDLSHQGIRDADVPALIAFLESLPTIKKLNLQDNMLNDRGIQLLASYKKFTELNLSANLFDADRIIPIAELPLLVKLNLANNPMTLEATRALAKNPCIISLNLENCALDDTMIEPFTTSEVTKKWQELSLQNNEKITEKSINLLQQTFPQLWKSYCIQVGNKILPLKTLCFFAIPPADRPTLAKFKSIPELQPIEVELTLNMNTSNKF